MNTIKRLKKNQLVILYKCSKGNYYFGLQLKLITDLRIHLSLP